MLSKDKNNNLYPPLFAVERMKKNMRRYHLKKSDLEALTALLTANEWENLKIAREHPLLVYLCEKLREEYMVENDGGIETNQLLIQKLSMIATDGHLQKWAKEKKVYCFDRETIDAVQKMEISDDALDLIPEEPILIDLFDRGNDWLGFPRYFIIWRRFHILYFINMLFSTTDQTLGVGMAILEMRYYERSEKMKIESKTCKFAMAVVAGLVETTRNDRQDVQMWDCRIPSKG